eukprot:jgi/Mesen1/2290/ME000154S01457
MAVSGEATSATGAQTAGHGPAVSLKDYKPPPIAKLVQAGQGRGWVQEQMGGGGSGVGGFRSDGQCCSTLKFCHLSVHGGVHASGWFRASGISREERIFLQQLQQQQPSPQGGGGAQRAFSSLGEYRALRNAVLLHFLRHISPYPSTSTTPTPASGAATTPAATNAGGGGGSSS